MFGLKFRAALTASALCAALLGAASSHAGLFDDHEARRAILDLQSRLDALESQLSAAPRALLEQSNRLEQLQQQIAELRGQMEALSHQFDSMQQRTKDAYAELDRRLQPLEPQQRTVDGIQGTVQPGEAEAFDTALQLFRKGDFKRAEALFKNFIAQYPASPYQPTAQYWLGNALYAQREYKSAIAILERVVKRYPAHPRAPEALLAIAQIQLEQGQKSAARKTLQQIIDRYHDTEAAQSARRQLAQ
ncbi:Tol-Pal complex protein (ygcF) [Candidatus Glomeribacter gigasporarum BEG34]|uniref:Cell division coordinator CpoB n=1 Tax=Candidatus Glomeribacter gigasporarum BEG34 TaxID=1070319 RepID=G2JAF7_9BURK|nr:tol-pal system protein YbgF [Candidatus Glomeribacter gigasporarum]CCD29759.1 Tol-Pal complex protein (ygcF) [Candidatus Glomeribacter gigasporarum BEG34]